jgi:hypothetical protein
MNITRNRQSVSFTTDHTDGDIVQTSEFLNGAGLPIPLNDYLINGVHVVASTGPLARQVIREHAAQADAAAAESDAYTPPATWHPGRCYCAVFAGAHHIPGMTQPGAYGTQCKGDRVAPHDASSCGACLAGATDFRPAIEAGQTWISNQYNSDHQVQGAGDEPGTWAMWGPVGNLHVISEAGLYSRYTLDLDH